MMQSFYNGRSARATRAVFAGFFLAILSLAAFAAGGGGNSSGGGPNPTDPSTNASSPGEEVTSLPMVSDESGITFIGGLRELRGLFLDVRGSGRVAVQRLGYRRFAVTFVGDFRLELDRRLLVSTATSSLFIGGAAFQGGVALLQIGDSPAQVVSAERVLLPIARLAASPRAQGALVSLSAFGRRSRAALGVNFAADRVVVTQRIF
jgi:hypothetical protein